MQLSDYLGGSLPQGGTLAPAQGPGIGMGGMGPGGMGHFGEFGGLPGGFGGGGFGGPADPWSWLAQLLGQHGLNPAAVDAAGNAVFSDIAVRPPGPGGPAQGPNFLGAQPAQQPGLPAAFGTPLGRGETPGAAGMLGFNGVNAAPNAAPAPGMLGFGGTNVAPNAMPMATPNALTGIRTFGAG